MTIPRYTRAGTEKVKSPHTVMHFMQQRWEIEKKECFMFFPQGSRRDSSKVNFISRGKYKGVTSRLRYHV